jgi:hypothetical protein
VQPCSSGVRDVLHTQLLCAAFRLLTVLKIFIHGGQLQVWGKRKSQKAGNWRSSSLGAGRGANFAP